MGQRARGPDKNLVLTCSLEFIIVKAPSTEDI